MDWSEIVARYGAPQAPRPETSPSVDTAAVTDQGWQEAIDRYFAGGVESRLSLPPELLSPLPEAPAPPKPTVQTTVVMEVIVDKVLYKRTIIPFFVDLDRPREEAMYFFEAHVGKLRVELAQALEQLTTKPS